MYFLLYETRQFLAPGCLQANPVLELYNFFLNLLLEKRPYNPLHTAKLKVL